MRLIMTVPKTDNERQLMLVVKKGDLTRTKELLKNNFKESNDQRYFDYHLIIQALSKSQIDIAKVLIEKGFRVHTEFQVEKTVLDYAVRLEDIDLVKTILAKGASSDILALNKQNKTPFHSAINSSQLLIIEQFMTHFEVEDFDEKNLLHYAVQQNKTQVIAQLMEKGLSLKKKNEKNLTPCCIAINSNKIKNLDCLLSSYNLENINLNNYDDVAPAYLSVIIGNLQVLKKFVELGLSINNPLKSNSDTWPCLDKYPGFALLHCAVKHTKLEIVEFLLSKGADILAQNENRESSLHIAFKNKEIGNWKTWQEFEDNNQIIDLLLKANMKLKSNPVNKNGLSHFHVACSRDEPKVVEHFLKLGIVINQSVNTQRLYYKGFTPLHFAAKFRCRKVLELLLKNGVDVKQRNFKGKTALHIAAMETCEDGVRLLLQYGADITSKDSDDNTPVHLAFQNQNYAVIDLLLSADNVAHSNPANTKGLSHFHIACTRNNVNVVKSFIKKGVSVDTCVPIHDENIDSNYKWGGYSPLHFAVAHNRSKIVELLLHSGANVRVKDDQGFTPLHIACRFTNEMFREFIKVTLSDPNKCKEITIDIRPITDIIKVNECQFRGFKGANCTRKFDWTPNQTEHLKIINLLLNTENNVNYVDNNGNAPIYYVYTEDIQLDRILNNNLSCSLFLWNQIFKSLSQDLYERRKSIKSKLLKLDIDYNKCYKNGSLLHYICSRKDKTDSEMMELVLKAGANVNALNNEMLTPLHQATLRQDRKLIGLLLNYGAHVDCINPVNNSTPLLTVTANGIYFCRGPSIIRFFIDKGANVNATQSDGKTALHNLASHSQSESDASICNLIKAGANVNSRDLNGLTPLHEACCSKNFKAATVLLENGANINLEDNEEKTACCYMYEKHLKNLPSSANGSVIIPYEQNLLTNLLQNHIIKMRAIGLTVSDKALSSYAKFKDLPSQTKEEREKYINKCKNEVQALKDKKISNQYKLRDMVFKDINALSQFVKNPAFKSVAQSKTLKQTYPNYGDLIQLKYQAGLERANLLPMAKCALNSLSGLHLPDVCSEHIFSYFTNVELTDSIRLLSSIFDSNAEISDNMKSKNQRKNKRQKLQ